MRDSYPRSRWYCNEMVTEVNEYINDFPVDEAICWEIINFIRGCVIIVIPTGHIVAKYDLRAITKHLK